MAIVRRGEGSPLSRIRGTWDPFEVMRDMLARWPGAELEPTPGGTEMLSPNFEVKETKDAFSFRADLPGVRQEDVDVSLSGNRLTISGERKAESEQEEGQQYYAYECSYGRFSRSFTLPEGVDAEHVSADLKDGVLTVQVPKTGETRPKRIQITSRTGASEKLKA